ncbi:hypothetical protein AB0K40_33740 [Nonomuraea bangladeshensis]|uniref:Endo-1,4-beta-xylanase n=1 Tax=Nonomuraea bangladeshensis TaxID=404385 RepID=A0ABV3HD96_9ACTN
MIRTAVAVLTTVLAASLLVAGPAGADAGRYAADIRRTEYGGLGAAGFTLEADQSELFARGQWVTGRFTEAEISAYPKLATTGLR